MSYLISIEEKDFFQALFFTQNKPKLQVILLCLNNVPSLSLFAKKAIFCDRP